MIGAGQMGTGIAEVAALAGYEVRLLDIDQAQLEQALERIRTHLDRRVGKGTLSDADARGPRSSGSSPAPTTACSPTASW